MNPNNPWCTVEQMCAKLGCHVDSLSRYARKGKLERQKSGIHMLYRYPEPDDFEVTDYDEESIPIPQASSVTTAKRKDVNGQFADAVNELAALKANSVKAKPVPPRSNRSLVLLVSDTHVGKHTDHYNPSVAAERIASIPSLVAELGLVSIGEIVLVLAGDMVDGEDIYAHQAHHLALPVIDQVKQVTESIWQLALDLRAQFKIPVRIETCYGNHGRISKTADPKSNWDNIVYQTLDLVSSNVQDKLITVNLSYTAFLTTEVQDKTVVVTHHGVKPGTGKNKLSGWQYTKHWDLLLHGHYHTWGIETCYGNPVIHNGAMVGPDDLSEAMGVYDPPRQSWCVITKNEPISQFGYFEW